MNRKSSAFPLFQSHLDLAHHYWNELVKSGETVIDATAGNGHDTLALASLPAFKEKMGLLIAMDKQASAIENTKQRLSDHLPKEQYAKIRLIQQCHSTFPDDLSHKSVKLIVYNLGYLPGGDKSLTTFAETTLQSLQAATKLVCPGGAISITCYPGHTEGFREEEAVLRFAATLDPKEWSCCHHRWINRKDAPSLLLLQKAQG